MLMTLSEVKKAYKAIGYNVCSCTYINTTTKSCCPISAIVLNEGCGDSHYSIVSAANHKYGQDKVLSFTYGFDGCIYNEAFDKDAFDNGVKIRKGLHVK